MERATPEMIAAAWATWHKRHGGKLGPGPAFVEAINAALSAGPDRRLKGDRDENVPQNTNRNVLSHHPGYYCQLRTPAAIWGRYLGWA